MKDKPRLFREPLEVIYLGFAPTLKSKIFKGDDGKNFCILETNQYDPSSRQTVPVKYWNYDSLLHLKRLVGKTLDKLEYWYFQDKYKRESRE